VSRCRGREKMWHLPVDEDYRDLRKSSVADLANTGGRLMAEERGEYGRASHHGESH
jgi:leucyl aminopeptidase